VGVCPDTRGRFIRWGTYRRGGRAILVSPCTSLWVVGWTVLVSAGHGREAASVSRAGLSSRSHAGTEPETSMVAHFASHLMVHIAQGTRSASFPHSPNTVPIEPRISDVGCLENAGQWFQPSKRSTVSHPSKQSSRSRRDSEAFPPRSVSRLRGEGDCPSWGSIPRALRPQAKPRKMDMPARATDAAKVQPTSPHCKTGRGSACSVTLGSVPSTRTSRSSGRPQGRRLHCDPRREGIRREPQRPERAGHLDGVPQAWRHAGGHPHRPAGTELEGPAEHCP
jgi:hypothetical protein